MLMSLYLLSFFPAAVFALILTPFAIKFAGKWGIMDYPGDRRVHKTPVPRLGGAALDVSGWLAVLIPMVSHNDLLAGRGKHRIKAGLFAGVRFLCIGALRYKRCGSAINPVAAVAAVFGSVRLPDPNGDASLTELHFGFFRLYLML
jgi:UDP-N-acetylmuramyl pentapeptide phosphotransferase/UDP-N-acetylglucosamine-1-phosphate transferase